MGISISACVICRNEAGKIGACLDSLRWCGDVVVVDSGSGDGTVEMARSHAAKPRVLHHEWEGYSGQREFAVGQCAREWVLMLDADEECCGELARELEGLTEEAMAKVAIGVMPRKNFIAGRLVRCWSPDRQARLIHRGRMQWEPGSVPEVRRAKAGYGEKRLRGALLHNRMAPFDPKDFVDGPMMEERAELLAQHMVRKGTRATFGNLLWRPMLTFFKYYVLRGGFLQGRFGLVMAYKTTIGVMLKYTALYAWQEFGEQRQRRK